MSQLTARYRYSFIILKQLVKTDFKLRYQGSVLGYLWSLLRPLALFSILYIVFVEFFQVGKNIPYFASYLLLGIVLWNFFAEITTGSVGAIVGKGDLLRKINFPRYVIIIATSVSALINLAFNFLVILLFMVLQGVDIRVSGLWAPFLLLELFIFALGLAFLLSALFVRFRDLNYIWEVLLQAGFYGTPILYPFSFVSDRSELAGKLLILNPMAQIIQDARYALITPQTLTIHNLYGTHLARLLPIAITLATFISFALYFRRRSRFFAEEV